MARGAGTGAGWFADPAGRFRFRFHDGVAWTDQVLDGRSRDEQTDTLEWRRAGSAAPGAAP